MGWPNRLNPRSLLERWLDSLWVESKASQVKDSNDVKVQRTPDGTLLKVNWQPTRNQPFFHPFKIYKVGELKYAVRGGYVGFRSAHGQFLSPDSTNDHPITGNGESVVEVFAGTDAVHQVGNTYDFWTSSTKPGGFASIEALSIPNGSDVGVASTSNGAIFALNSDLDGDGQQYASFWVELVDGSPPVAQVKARMWTQNAGSTGRRTDLFPDFYGNASDTSIQTTIIIPIGIIAPKSQSDAVNSSNPLLIEQYLSGHKINRYAPGVPNEDSIGGTMGPSYWRGEWTEDSLSGSFFYDGDLVSVDGDTFRILYAHQGNCLETAIGGNFRLVCGPTV